MVLINRFLRFLEGTRGARFLKWMHSSKAAKFGTAAALGYTFAVTPVMRRQMAAAPYVGYARDVYEQQRHGRRMFHEYSLGEPTYYDTGADGDVTLAMWHNRH